MTAYVAGVAIPDSEIALAAAAVARADVPGFVWRHSARVFVFAALMGAHRSVAFDGEMLYVAAMFHDVGLTGAYRQSALRFELDSANAARAFLAGYGVAANSAAEVWSAIALQTSFGIDEPVSSLTGLMSAGLETDLFGMHFDEIGRAERDEVLRAFPRDEGFKRQIIDAFAQGLMGRPATTFGTVNADVLERCDPDYRRLNFCGRILGSDWKE